MTIAIPLQQTYIGRKCLFGAMTHGYVHLLIGRQPFRELHFFGWSMSLDISFPLKTQVSIAIWGRNNQARGAMPSVEIRKTNDTDIQTVE